MSGLIEIEKFEAQQNEEADDEDPFINTNNYDETATDLNIDLQIKEEKSTPDEVFYEDEGPGIAKRFKKSLRNKRRSRRLQCKKKDRRVLYSCDKCDLTFHHIRLYKNHLVSHEPDSEVQDYICPHPNCSRKFLSQGGLKNHLNFHIGTELFHNCSYCETTTHFQTHGELEIHQIENHSEKLSQQTSLDIVGRSYSSSLESFKRNAKRKRIYKCETCTKSFGNIIVYRKHLRTHDDSKNFDNNKLTSKLTLLHSEKSSPKALRQKKNIQTNSPLIPNEKKIENAIENTETLNSNCNTSIKCPLCPCVFFDALKHDVHSVRVHGMPVKCSRCNKTFPTVHRLFRHHSVHNQPVFKCRQLNCNASFRTQNSLNVHEKKHQGISPYDCPNCAKSFQTKSECVQHRTEVHGENINANLRIQRSKPICDEEDSDLKSITRKINPLIFPCTRPNCEAVFKWSKSLEIHERKHDGLLPYACPICNESFLMKQDCNQHRIDVHKEKLSSGVTQSRVQCEFCGAVFKKSYTLIRHVTREHSDEKSFACGICGKKFAMKYDYNLHLKYHSGKFVCEICGKVYHSKGDLIRHTKIHTSDSQKPFKCDICMKGFTRQDHFVEHSRIHTGEKPHYCDICGNSYRNTSSLSSHKERSHRSFSNEKETDQLKCFQCSKYFSNQIYLKAHLKRVHGKDINGITIAKPKPKMYPCDLCDKQFHKRVRLVAHRVKHATTIPYKYGSLESTTVRKINGNRCDMKHQDHNKNVHQDLNDKVSENLDCTIPMNGSDSFFQLTNVVYSELPLDYSKQSVVQRVWIDSEQEKGQNTADGSNICLQSESRGQATYFESTTNTSDSLTESVFLNEVNNKNHSFKPDINDASPDDSNFHDEFELHVENSSIHVESVQNVDAPEIVSVTAEVTSNIMQDLEPVILDLIKIETPDDLLEIDKVEVPMKKFDLRDLLIKLTRIPTYPCKPCKTEFHNKILQEKHCRTYQHWKTVRSIKQIEQNSERNGKINEDSQVYKAAGRYCPICDAPSPTLKELTSHCRTEHPGQKAFSCALCGSSYYNYKHLKHHEAVTHKQQEQYNCLHCEEKYTCYELFRKHTATHKNEERKCSLCNETFTVLKVLIRHCELTHPGEKSFVCDICGTGYSQYKMFRIHRTRFHTAAELHADDPSKIRKPGRGRGKLHGEGGRSICDICGKEVLHMKVHMETHEAESRHLCDVCGMGFKRRSNMVNHKRRHLGERKFQCPLCAKSFYFMRDVRLHSLTHNKNYACTSCPQRFSSEELLQKHLGLHNNARPYRCDICGFMFNFRSNLMTHINKIHCKTVKS